MGDTIMRHSTTSRQHQPNPMRRKPRWKAEEPFESLLSVLEHAIHTEGLDADEVNELLNPAFIAIQIRWVVCSCGYERPSTERCGLPCV